MKWALPGLDGGDREEVLRSLGRVAEPAYRECGVAPPPWVEELRAEGPAMGDRGARMAGRNVRGRPGEVARLRAALRDAVGSRTLRGVAEELGMSPTGLSNFIAGTQPYGKTLHRLRAWAERNGIGGPPPPVDADQLRRYVETLPDPDVGVRLLLDAVDEAYATAKMFAPGWVQQVRHELGETESAP